MKNEKSKILMDTAGEELDPHDSGCLWGDGVETDPQTDSTMSRDKAQRSFELPLSSTLFYFSQVLRCRPLKNF